MLPGCPKWAPDGSLGPQISVRWVPGSAKKPPEPPGDLKMMPNLASKWFQDAILGKRCGISENIDIFDTLGPKITKIRKILGFSNSSKNTYPNENDGPNLSKNTILLFFWIYQPS